MPKIIGYARVSTFEQDPALQTRALREAGCDPVFCDHGLSGANTDRPELNLALAALERGDKLIVWKLDRLARSVSHLVQLVEDFRQRGIAFESLTEKIDTASAHGEFVFHILAGFAQMERRLISERTRAGLEIARQNGQKLGRPHKLDIDKCRRAKVLMDEGLSIKAAAGRVGVSPVTLLRSLERVEQDIAA